MSCLLGAMALIEVLKCQNLEAATIILHDRDANTYNEMSFKVFKATDIYKKVLKRYLDYETRRTEKCFLEMLQINFNMYTLGLMDKRNGKLHEGLSFSTLQYNKFNPIPDEFIFRAQDYPYSIEIKINEELRGLKKDKKLLEDRE